MKYHNQLLYLGILLNTAIYGMHKDSLGGNFVKMPTSIEERVEKLERKLDARLTTHGRVLENLRTSLDGESTPISPTLSQALEELAQKHYKQQKQINKNRELIEQLLTNVNTVTTSMDELKKNVEDKQCTLEQRLERLEKNISNLAIVDNEEENSQESTESWWEYGNGLWSTKN